MVLILDVDVMSGQGLMLEVVKNTVERQLNIEVEVGEIRRSNRV